MEMATAAECACRIEAPRSRQQTCVHRSHSVGVLLAGVDCGTPAYDGAPTAPANDESLRLVAWRSCDWSTEPIRCRLIRFSLQIP
ncbi:unnamed protein product [Boreogadus saida]